MKRYRLKTSFGLLMLVLVSGLVMASPSFALDVDLAAVEGTWTPPGGAPPVTMWGFVPDTGACPGAPVLWDVGPVIAATAGDVLNINLRNCLTEPVSVVIPGQSAVMTPTWTDDSSGNRTSAAQRVRSLTHETAPGAVGLYTWDSVRAGTYLYESGTHQALQVPMGLYGALKVDVAPGMAYPGVPYDNEVVLLYSEVDPALHGPPATARPTNYNPSYFLVNGEPFVQGSTAPIPAGAPGEATIVRLLSAALRDVVPTVSGAYWDIIAEDGNPYPHARRQYSALMPPGKTRDAILALSGSASLWVYDRRLSLTNGMGSPGGLMANLLVSAFPPGVLAIFNAGTWTFDSNGSGALEPGIDATFKFGRSGDIPVTGDWDGTGTTRAGIYRDGFWYLDVNGNGLWDGQPTDKKFKFGGQPGDIPVTGDWDGTGSARAGVFRNGTWYLDVNGNGLWDGQPTDRKHTFGQAGDIPLAGDWDATGISRIGVFRNGTWLLDLNGNGVLNAPPVDASLTFGTAGDTPAVLGP